VAFLPEDRREELLSGELPELTGLSATEPRALAEQLEEVRKTGYALEDQESALGDAGIAAPVFDRTGHVVGAIGIVGPVERLFADSARQEHAVAVREVARNVSRELGAGRAAARRTAGA
jgi:DNA-binding IclR family transcriptional regulator